MRYDKQMMMISLMADRLQESITEYQMFKMHLHLEDRVPATKIRRQILELRQALLELDKCFR